MMKEIFGKRAIVKNSKSNEIIVDGKLAIQIPLTQGFFAIIDAEDYDLIKLRSWAAMKRKGRNEYYAAAYGGKTHEGKRFKVAMHVLLCPLSPGMEVDHRNGNSLDNRRSNLRLCSHKNNMRNMRKTKKGSSRFKGVSFYKARSCWRAYIVVDAKHIGLGYFECEDDAAKAYDSAAKRLFGEFAFFNFPQGD